jgi:hypothetical protein
MTITQTVEIPDSHRLVIDVPREIPAGLVVLSFTSQSGQEAEMDETEYLMRSPANRERLDRAIKNVKEGKIISFDTIEQARQYAEELNTVEQANN